MEVHNPGSEDTTRILDLLRAALDERKRLLDIARRTQPLPLWEIDPNLIYSVRDALWQRDELAGTFNKQ